MYFTNRFMREAGTEGGSGIGLSLAELEALSTSEAGKDLQVAAAEQEAAAAAKLVADAAAEAAKTNPLTSDPAKPADQSTDPNKDLTPEQKVIADAAKVEADKGATVAAVSTEPADTTDDDDYYAVVDKITGRQYEIEYPENIDPTTPEGTAHRENFIREASFAEYEEFLKEKNPKGFAYLLHTQNGGTDEDFFGDKKGFVLPAKDQVEASVEVQTMVYKQDLISMGIDPDSAQALVEKAVKDNKLQERALSSFTKIEGAQKAYLAGIEQSNKERHEFAVAAVSNITTHIDGAINELNVIVPEGMKPAFKQFVLDNLQMTPDGKFMIVQELDPKNLKLQIGSMFYQHIKGDMTQIVAKKVRTEAAQKLKLQADRTKTNVNKDIPSGSTTNKTLTLGEL